MFRLAKRKERKANEDHKEETPSPPPEEVFNIFDGAVTDMSVHFIVRHPWKWVMESIGSVHMKEYQKTSDLPSSRLAAKTASEIGATPPARRRRRSSLKRAGALPSTLKIELCDASGTNVIFAAHGTSSALGGLEDKDELVRTMQRCRCEDKHLSPPSVLINWDATHEECLKIVGKDLPVVEGNNSQDKVAVLKEPMGSQGMGVYFVRTAEDIHTIVGEHRQRALDEPGFLDTLIDAKGRIPSWGKSQR